MNIIKTVNKLNAYHQKLNGSIGFVATMGCLHAGHLSLIERAKQENTYTIVSIFVNPTQFNNPDDLTNYPQPIEKDLALLQEAGVDAVFLPTKELLYPDDYHYRLTTIDPLAEILEGEFRPGHYDGVLSIVMKLFNIVRPTRVYFGEKDYQQATLIQRMTESFFMGLEVVVCPIVRESSGLALSSRNTRLSLQQRQLADFFAKTFLAYDDPNSIKEQLSANNIRIEYIKQQDSRLFAAIYIDNIRLIDTRALKQSDP